MRTGMWIPAFIEQMAGLTLTEKAIYAEICALHKNGKCFASNSYFAKLVGLKEDTISRTISKLKKRGLVVQSGFDGRKRYLAPTALDSDTKQGRVGEKNITSRVADVPKPALDSKPTPISNIVQFNKLGTITEKIRRFSKETRESLEVIWSNCGVVPEDTPDRIRSIWMTLCPTGDIQYQR